MNGESSSVDAGAPKLNLTPEEKHIYGQLFRQADTEGVGVVTGEIAVKFFDKTRLDSRVLGEIWQIADRENRGFLTPAGFGVVLRLIGHAQAGREPSPEIALQQGPIPRFDGFTPTPLPTLPNPLPGPPPGAPPALQGLQAQGTGSAPIRIPPLTPEKVAQYAAIFERQPLQNGNMLSGEQARQIFEKSGLPNEILGRIWMLADTEQRGALVQTEFVIAMHLLSSLKAGVLRGLPNILPAALYEAATRRAPIGGPIARQQTSSPTTAAPMSAIPRQLSGQAPLTQLRTGSPLARPSLAPQTTGSDWLITPADKSRFDVLYAELDKTNKGYITGEEAVPFFSQSNLPEDTLAQIWDLADLRSEGRLNKDQFAVAMYLIRQQRSKKDGPSNLPTTLPANLIPPSMRDNIRPPANTASPFDAPPPSATSAAPPRPTIPPPKPSALDDLFGLDSPQPSAPAQVPIATGSSAVANDPFSTSSSPQAPLSPLRPSGTGTQFKPFIPSSSFGRNLLPQGTGGSSSSVPVVSKPQAQSAAADDDLLGDNDPEISSKLNNETTELANLSNQIGSLSKQMHDVQSKRTNMQNELNQASEQKKNFEQRLAQLRSAYEKEAQDVRALETQLANARNDTKKLSTEMAGLEGNYQDLVNQRAQVLAALQADQNENSSLKERIRAVNTEIAQLKPQIEKLKSEARQQKGLVAINKKQLSTNEGERDKLKTEADDLVKENEELARQIHASSPPPAQIVSPALSTTSANNPFFRRTGSTDIAGAFASPTMKPFNDRSFDDVFGPSPYPPVGQTSASPPPPPSAFKPQTTGTSTTSVTSGSFATPTSTSPNISRQGTLPTEPAAAPGPAHVVSSHSLFPDTQEPVSSSRQVSPPSSRVAQTDTPSGETQAAALASPAEVTPSGPSPATDSDTEVARSQTSTDESNPAGTGEDATGGGWWGGKAKEGGGDGVIAAAGHAAESLLHAAAGVKDSIFGSSQDDQAKSPVKEDASEAFPPVDHAKAKEDFDSAFASFKTARAKAPAADVAKPFSTSHTEFPPIAELENDDDSDSDSDRGFDDDFAPASPPLKSAEKKTDASEPSSPALQKSFPAEHALSPPRMSSFAAPADRDKSASPVIVAANQPTNATAANADDIFGSNTSYTAAPHPSVAAHAAPVLPSAGSKGAFDDMDDEFDDLEDAKEGSADDDFANIPRGRFDDFNPVFDSSPPQSQAVKSDTDTFNTKHGAGEGSFDFGSLSTGSTAGSTAAAVGATTTASEGLPSQDAHNNAGAVAGGNPQNNPSDAHDWDAIFSSLDEPTAAAGVPSPPTAPPAASPIPAAPKESLSASRPTAPGRALTEAGVHDDPILKNLTSMGYSRADALSALEKYDYNLERAANFLASQS